MLRLPLTALATGLVLNAPTTSAQNLLVPLEIARADPMALLASAEQVIPLVRRTRDIEISDNGTTHTYSSDLRVSLIVLDNGVGTDLSPRRDVHIALWNVIPEFGIAWALEPLASIFEFGGAKRAEPGIYTFTGTIADYEGAYPGCNFPRMRFTIDARQLSVDVRQARGLTHMEHLRIDRAPGLEMKNIGCGDG